MKKQLILKLSFFCALIAGICNNSFSQSKELPAGYYVIVAAYGQTRQDMASAYAEKLKSQGYKADYGFNQSRHMYFVYLNYFTDLKTSVHDMTELRKKGVFTDAWVRIVGVPGSIKNDLAGSGTEKTESKDKSPGSSPKKEGISTSLVIEELNNQMSVEEPPAQLETPPEILRLMAETDSTASIPVAPMEEEAIVALPGEPATFRNAKVFLSLFNSTNRYIVDGEVVIVEPDKGKVIRRVEGNEYITLPDPKNSSKKLLLVTDVFGYRKIQHEFNYANPLQDTIHPYFELLDNNFLVYFDLVRYRKGDIATLYHVYFYNDASVMLPQSQFELNNLVDLMRENPDYRVKFHGHTNGNYHGKIISPGPDMNFFDIHGNIKETIGSAKELSAQRALILKQYLIAHGIDASRMEIKAWGGKRPVYDRNSVNAKRNVRVEVEIMED